MSALSGVIVLIGTTERGHRLSRVDSHLREAVPQEQEMAVLGRRHPRQRRLVVDTRRDGSISRDALEGGQLAVGQDPQDVDHCRPVLRVGLEGRWRRGVFSHGALRLASPARYSSLK